MLVCIAMLIGTTFSCFTDTAQTAVNRIASGNLNIEMEYLDVASGEWKTVRSDKPLFDNNAFWEPGFSQVAYLRIRNAGNLAVKYKIAITVAGETPGMNISDDQFLLSDYIMYGVKEGQQTAFANREAINTVLPGVALKDYTKEGSMLPGETVYLALVVFISTTAGN